MPFSDAARPRSFIEIVYTWIALLLIFVFSAAVLYLPSLLDQISQEGALARADSFLQAYRDQDFQEAAGQLCPEVRELLARQSPDGAAGYLASAWRADAAAAAYRWDTERFPIYHMLYARDVTGLGGQMAPDILVHLRDTRPVYAIWDVGDAGAFCVQGVEGGGLSFLLF